MCINYADEIEYITINLLPFDVHGGGTLGSADMGSFRERNRAARAGWRSLSQRGGLCLASAGVRQHRGAAFNVALKAGSTAMPWAWPIGSEGFDRHQPVS